MEAPELYINQNNMTSSAAGGGGEHFAVEDLLDFSNEEDAIVTDVDGPYCEISAFPGNSTDSSTLRTTTAIAALDTSCNSSSFSGCEPNYLNDFGSRRIVEGGQFSSDLCVPYDDIAELEWLSNFVEESFSSNDLQRLQLISGIKVRTTTDVSSETAARNFQPEPNRHGTNPNIFFNSELMSVPAKARSKRSRAPPCNWTSRLVLMSPTASFNSLPPPESSQDVVVSAPPAPTGPTTTTMAKKTVKGAPKKKDVSEVADSGGEGRKCLHCATDKTPQWRTGPMGPKTLCNACGVRYKSGRLVPEYRPAASPTFVLTKHSNSHRKVLELRRQKEMVRSQHQPQFLHHHRQHHQSMMFDASNNGEDYLIHQHVGPDFRQMI
ncbi:GATA transcription factor 12-like [Humulus lupulus]|uniref:GATA transcription factor 12-like n=1 Tax=Humulus lupulus TaxID=3486 RepID=UPI002B40F56A|nr:GATA transcription factor 12-like [Humulus lupulus]